MMRRLTFVVFIICLLSSGARLEAGQTVSNPASWIHSRLPHNAAFIAAITTAQPTVFEPLAADPELNPFDAGLNRQPTWQIHKPKTQYRLLDHLIEGPEWRVVSMSTPITIPPLNPIWPAASVLPYRRIKWLPAQPQNRARKNAPVKSPQAVEQPDDAGYAYMGPETVAVKTTADDNPQLHLAPTKRLSPDLLEPAGVVVQQEWRDRLRVRLYDKRWQWEAKVAPTYPLTRIRLESEDDILDFYHELNPLYHPKSALSLAPAIGFEPGRVHASEIWTETPSVSLLLTYEKLFDIFDFQATSSYARSRSNDGIVDTRTIDATVTLEWHLSMIRWGRVSISIDMSYSDYFDEVFPTNSHGEFYSGLAFRLRFS